MTTPIPATALPIPDLTGSQKATVLVAGFLGWMFAGLHIALFILILRSAMIDLMGGGATGVTPEAEQKIKEWFAWFQAAFLLGAAAGGWLFGILGDRVGRTRSLALSVLCYSLFTAGCYLARSPGELIVWRFLACLGIGGAWPNTVALVAEAWPGASRPFLAGILGTAANVGQVLMGFCGVWFDITADSWRWTLLVGSAPALIGLWCLVAVPESARWRRARLSATATQSGPLKELLQPPLRSRLIIGILLGAIPVIGTAANAQWIVPWSDQVEQQRAAVAADSSADETAPRPKADPKAKARTTISRSSGAVIGSLIGGILATLLGRRLTYFLISLATFAASCIIFGWMNPADPGFLWASFAFGLVGVIYFGWLPLYLPELFPTRVRATGAGISFNTGRVVAAVVALCTGVMLNLFGGDYARIGWWTGMIYLAGMVIILFAPRTDTNLLRD
jgi:MFS family permease